MTSKHKRAKFHYNQKHNHSFGQHGLQDETIKASDTWFPLDAPETMGSTVAEADQPAYEYDDIEVVRARLGALLLGPTEEKLLPDSSDNDHQSPVA